MILRLRGFTLIELMIALAIFGFLIMLAGPQLGKFMANSQIRNAAEAMLNGVQQAQSTAIRGNTLARLVVDKTTGTGGWQVLQTIDGVEPAGLPNPIQIYKLHDGAPKTNVTSIPGDATQITFDGLGRIVPNVDASPTLACLKVTDPSGSRNLNVAISNTGTGIGTKMCDPDPALLLLVPPDPRVCPAACL
jgi:type IV fimbrial biogenesis protein FimT